MKKSDLLKEFDSFVSRYKTTNSTLQLRDDLLKEVFIEYLESMGYRDLKLCGRSTDFMEVENRMGGDMYFLVWQSSSSISWPDDGKQPEVGERLFEISFPTGAYIFSDDYETSKPIFNDFFEEIKSYNPIYCDSNNRSLFWDIKDGIKVYSNYDRIFMKYRDIVSIAIKKSKISELEHELSKLKGE